jgi:hypothetical protein
MGIALATLSSIAWGFNAAMSPSRYWALEDQPDFMLIRKAGDQLIFKRYDFAAARWDERLAILKVDKDRVAKLRSTSLRTGVPKAANASIPCSTLALKLDQGPPLESCR